MDLMRIKKRTSKSDEKQEGKRNRRKAHMPSDDDEEGSFLDDDKPKKKKKGEYSKLQKVLTKVFQLVSSAKSRSKRESDEDDNENLGSNPITAPTADAPDSKEGVVPNKDGGLFDNDSMISKPPKSLTKTSDKGKLEEMFDDGIRPEDHKEENSYDSDASSKILYGESYG